MKGLLTSHYKTKVYPSIFCATLQNIYKAQERSGPCRNHRLTFNINGPLQNLTPTSKRNVLVSVFYNAICSGDMKNASLLTSVLYAGCDLCMGPFHSSQGSCKGYPACSTGVHSLGQSAQEEEGLLFSTGPFQH
jgi:hypothetical protein